MEQEQPWPEGNQDLAVNPSGCPCKFTKIKSFCTRHVSASNTRDTVQASTHCKPRHNASHQTLAYSYTFCRMIALLRSDLRTLLGGISLVEVKLAKLVQPAETKPGHALPSFGGSYGTTPETSLPHVYLHLLRLE